jgi:UDP-GlcNAc:undecaprenyl-phosphate GlcNAc-1-phosphate transferase
LFLLFVFVVATAVSLAAGGMVRRAAPAIGAVVPPRPDRWHSTPTPTMGGIAIVAGTAAGFMAIVARGDLIGVPASWAPVPLAALAMFIVGVLDDRLQLSAVAKLVASLAIGAFLVFALAGAEPEGAAPSFTTLVSIVWFAGVCHALNLLDNMDGLAAGVGLIAVAFFASLLSGSLGPTLVVLLTAVAGALLGFLYWNRTPARLFMGDSGSLFIGATLAATSLVPVFNTGLAFISPAVIAILILVVPLFDTAFVLVLRRLAGRRATKGGTDHISHRLVSLGFSERSAVRVLYLLGLIGGGTAWLLIAYSGVEPMLPAVAIFRRTGDAPRDLFRAGARLQRRGLQGAAEVHLRAVPQGSRVQVARRRGDAGPRPDHGVLLRGLPAAVRGRGSRQLPPVLHGHTPDGARMQARLAVRVGSVPALLGDLRPARPDGGDARRAGGLVHVGRRPLLPLPG